MYLCVFLCSHKMSRKICLFSWCSKVWERDTYFAFYILYVLNSFCQRKLSKTNSQIQTYIHVCAFSIVGVCAPLLSLIPFSDISCISPLPLQTLLTKNYAKPIGHRRMNLLANNKLFVDDDWPVPKIVLHNYLLIKTWQNNNWMAKMGAKCSFYTRDLVRILICVLEFFSPFFLMV